MRRKHGIVVGPLQTLSEKMQPLALKSIKTTGIAKGAVLSFNKSYMPLSLIVQTPSLRHSGPSQLKMSTVLY